MALFVSVCSNICARCASYIVHLKRKCSTVSLARPQAHISDSAAPIWCRYPFSRVMPVRSCASAFASLLLKASYRALVCLPGSAVSICFENLPMLSGSTLSWCLLDLAVFMIVDFACCDGPCHQDKCVCVCLFRLETLSLKGSILNYLIAA